MEVKTLVEMDPTFEATFREQFPEEFEEALAKREKLQKSKDSTLASKTRIRLVPNVLIRLSAAIAIMLLIAGGYLLLAPQFSDVPSGPAKSAASTVVEDIDSKIDSTQNIFTRLIDRIEFLWDH